MIFGYCQRTHKTKQGTKRRKKGLLSMIKNKLNKKGITNENSSDNSSSEVKKGGPLNKTRKIEIGWLFEEDDKKLKQVRLKTGGGTRKLDVPKMCTCADVLNIGKSLFFPGDISAKGPLSDFDLEIRDFAQNKLDENINVGEMYDTTKINLLRFYLVTKRKLSSVSRIQLPRVTSTVTRPTSSNIETPAKSKPNNLPTDIATRGYRSNIGTPATWIPKPDNLQPLKSTGACSLTSNIEIESTDILNEAITKIGEILHKPVSYVRILSNGEAEVGVGSGVERDTFSAFWSEFYAKYTVGDTAKVPVLRHDMGVTTWQAVARIIIKGYETCGYWPLKIASPFLEEAMFGTVISDLTTVFFNHVSHSEREVLKLALNDFDTVDKEELMDILSTYDCRKIATADNIKYMLTEIAHKEIIQRPMFIIDSMRSVFVLKQEVIDLDEFTRIYARLTPSTKNVLSILRFPACMTDRQTLVANHLKRFIRGLDSYKLELFLRFCTGSDQNTEGDISVLFTEMSDFAKKPIARTCGKSLELPLDYENFTDFNSNFNCVLTSNIWLMDMI
ncbi:hypothetical protein LOTGIDRAFT_164040 [Lottia gigantea]|uniref:HECT domain-containing protein n=1 Tax=Lottia gigantea TaxID=225164 RepID=V4AAZ3_LOTGI|nr:hypothetical protein LOTGIDRAFT_164040 [Lottia gigantea]ESO90461.1 hypothetical protein LOTGIDRAFT_164040 [Lottia gigantea]